MKSGKTGNKAAACSVCHRLISTIQCEFKLGPAVPLCVTVLGVAPPAWRSSHSCKNLGATQVTPSDPGGGSRRSLAHRSPTSPQVLETGQAKTDPAVLGGGRVRVLGASWALRALPGVLAPSLLVCARVTLS